MKLEKYDLKKILLDGKFVNELLALDTGEKVRWALKKKGIILEKEDMDEFAKFLIRALETSYKHRTKRGHLSAVHNKQCLEENQLSAASGGTKKTTYKLKEEFNPSIFIVNNNFLYVPFEGVGDLVDSYDAELLDEDQVSSVVGGVGCNKEIMNSDGWINRDELSKIIASLDEESK